MNTSSKARPRHKPPRKGPSKTVLNREESEDALDQALQDTYPASDPLAIIQPGHKPPGRQREVEREIQQETAEMIFEEIDRLEIYERGPRKRLAVQEAAEILGVRAHTLRYGSARYETEGLDPVEPVWACTVPLHEVLEIQALR